MLVFDTRGDKLGAGALHFRKQPLTGFVDERDVGKVHYRACARRALSRVSPTLAQLVDPRAGEMSAQAPALAAGVIALRNPKHPHYLSTGPEKACVPPNAAMSFSRV